MHEDFIQTLRLILLNGYEHDEADTTAWVKELAAKVPAVFASLRLDYTDEKEEIGVVALQVMADADHPNPQVLLRIDPQDHKKATGLAVTENQMSKAFNIMLRQAYKEDYKKVLVITGKRPIRWWKKVGFDHRYVDPPLSGGLTNHLSYTRRSVFQRGQYIKYRDGKLGRLDQILSHEAVYGQFIPYTPLRVAHVT